MAEYILRTDAERIMAMLVMEVSARPKDFTCGEAVRAIRSIPSADVAPVRHGRWIWDENGMDWGIGSWRCSECRARPETWWQGERSSPLNKSGHYYCPNCGAKMDGE